MDLFSHLAMGFGVSLSVQNLLWCFVGVFLGTFIGVLPGIGSFATISMLLPITFHLQATTAIIMLAGIHYGANYGGSTASILLNLPGTPSAAVACLNGYPMAKKGQAGVALTMKISKTPERFGRGAIEGVTAPESANNAASQTAFFPTLTLGIPGNVTMALMLGALIIQGIQPGPRLFTEYPELFWGLAASFWIGNAMLVVLNLPLIGIWVAMLRIPYHLLYPAILMFIVIGVFSINNSAFDVHVVMMFGIVGYIMMLLRFEPAPLLLGFVLGLLMEEHLRRAMLLSRGDPMVFVERPISAVFITITVALLALAVWSMLKPRQKRSVAEEPA
jgi:TctA family transporter